MKRRNLILAGLVVLVWGIALKTVFTRPEPLDQKPRRNIPAPQVASEQPIEVDQYSRDPFLSILADTAFKSDTVKPVTPVKKEMIQPDLPRYCGFIANGKEKLAILELAGKYYFVKEKDKVAGYVIKKIKEEWLTLRNGVSETRIELHKQLAPHYVLEH